MKYIICLFFFLLPLLSTLNAQESDSLKIVTVFTYDKQYFVGKLIHISSDSIFIRDDEFRSLAFSKKNVKSLHDGIILPSLNAHESDSLKIVTVFTHDKQYFAGELIHISSDSIFIRTDEFSSLAFSKSNIKSLHDGIILPSFSETTNSSVPYYVQSARPNGRGNHYYKNYYIFGNEFNFGLSDNMNVTVGFESATLVFGSGGNIPLIQLGAKYSVPVSHNFYAGLSSKYYFNNEGSALMISSPLTLGSKRTNFTIAPTYIYADESGMVGIFSNVSLAVSAKSRFLIDFVYIDETSIFAFNLEFLFKSGFTLTVGAIVAGGGVAPSLSFSIPFGSWKNSYQKQN